MAGRSRRKRPGGRPTRYSLAIRNKVLSAIEHGATFDSAAREAEISPATLYRWTNRYPSFEAAVREAGFRRDRLRAYLLGLWRDRPRVPWSKTCPECGDDLEVRTAGGMAGFRFWRCSRWPRCGFARWRPPTPWKCPLCGEVTFWSHSRKTYACETYWCGYRQRYVAG